MKIVADENLKYVEKLFAKFGELQLLPGRDIEASTVADADVLLVRSVTKVDEALLAGSQVKFVGSATSGVEHIDQYYLKRKGIRFAHAKGSNALAVAQYCLAALCFSEAAGNFSFRTGDVGLVGCGFVGSKLASLLRGLDIPVKVFDPLLDAGQTKQLRDWGVELVDLGDVFDCTAVSLHTPLTVGGSFPTIKMIDEALLARLGSTATFINASRGGVVDEQALLDCLDAASNIFCVLDVWENEPEISQALLLRANIATPHIAGYSRRAKTGATETLLQQYSEDYLKLPLTKSASDDVAGKKAIKKIESNELSDSIKQALPLEKLSAEFKRKSLASLPQPMAHVFDDFRKSMIDRAEFSDFEVSGGLEVLQAKRLKQLGFLITNSPS